MTLHLLAGWDLTSLHLGICDSKEERPACGPGEALLCHGTSRTGFIVDGWMHETERTKTWMGR